MSNKKIIQDILEKLSLFRLNDRNTIIRPADLVILIPENDFNAFLRGYSDFIDINNAEITFKGIKCRKTKENNLIIGIE